VKYRELTEIECVIGFTLHIKAFRYATFLSGGCGYMRKTFPVADGTKLEGGTPNATFVGIRDTSGMGNRVSGKFLL